MALLIISHRHTLLSADHFVYADGRADGDDQVDERLQPLVPLVEQLLVEDPETGQEPDGPPDETSRRGVTPRTRHGTRHVTVEALRRTGDACAPTGKRTNCTAEVVCEKQPPACIEVSLSGKLRQGTASKINLVQLANNATSQSVVSNLQNPQTSTVPSYGYRLLRP